MRIDHPLAAVLAVLGKDGVLEGARPGAILDLHDADGVPGAGRRLVEALPSMVQALRSDGYALAPLSDLL
jgi:peptidoglycan/xylan/chitin deacetylase (PgdA/CDA1 family)